MCTQLIFSKCQGLVHDKIVQKVGEKKIAAVTMSPDVQGEKRGNFDFFQIDFFFRLQMNYAWKNILFSKRGLHPRPLVEEFVDRTSVAQAGEQPDGGDIFLSILFQFSQAKT